MKCSSFLKKRDVFFRLLLLGMGIFLISVDTHGATVDVRIGNMVVPREVHSVKDLRYKEVVRQTKDYSCGAAALGTILTYYFGKETTENEVLDSILSKMDEETTLRVMKDGVTLLDLKRYGDSQGYAGRGYRLAAEDLAKLDRPGIVLINYRGYNHFVVVKGVLEDQVYLADPARGNMVKSFDEFKSMWNGIVLVFVNSKGDTINKHELKPKPMNKNELTKLWPDMVNFHFVTSPLEF